MEFRHERRLYGHRGSSALLPENTLPAFRQALADGATALEMDVHVTADGWIVVSHDPDGRRRAGVPRAIRECSYAEVSQWLVGTDAGGQPARVPAFADIVAAFPGIRLNVDIKPADPALAAPVVDEIRRQDAEDRVTLASFHSAVLQAVRSAGYRGELSLWPAEVARAGLLPESLLRFFPPRGQAVQIPPRYQGLDLGAPWIIRKFHRLGLRVDYWVVNAPDEARRLIDAGADGIFSDAPARVKAAVLAPS